MTIVNTAGLYKDKALETRRRRYAERIGIAVKDIPWVRVLGAKMPVCEAHCIRAPGAGFGGAAVTARSEATAMQDARDRKDAIKREAARATRPLAFVWDGEAMTPKSARLADETYVIGGTYLLAEHQQRSVASHNHEFAWLTEAWKNLPEHLADEFPTAEHLRKRALIAAGYYRETIVDVGTQAAALRVAADMRTLAEFAVIVTRGGIVIRREAKSQSRRAMDPKEFQASKQALMDAVSAMIGTSADALRTNAGRAA